MKMQKTGQRNGIKRAGLTLAALLAFILVIQLVPYGRDHTNPPVVQEPKWDAPQTRAFAQRSCFDCHSNETVWPWYSNYAPFSWLIAHDAEEGRQRLNFSDWNNVNPRVLNEIQRVVSNGSMPPIQYTLIHGKAVLTTTERQAFIDGLNNSLK
jgi:mono/diheme cytochrome c family protein